MQTQTNKRTYDNRDLYLGTGALPLGEPPVSYKTDVSEVRRLYQWQLGTCGAHAGATFKAIQELSDVGMTDGCSPRCLWSFIKEIDGLSTGVGTDMRSIFKALATKGVCKYSTLPNEFPMEMDVYTHPTLTTEMLDEANTMLINGGYAFLPSGFTLHDLRSAIFRYGAVIMLIYCDNGFWGTKYPTFSKKTYGHFITCFGYDENSIFVLDSDEENLELCEKVMYNSYFPYIREVGTATDLSTEQLQALIKKKNLLTKIAQAYQQIINLKNQYDCKS